MDKLDEAVDLATRATRGRSPTTRISVGDLANLSSICQARYDVTGNEKGLETCLDSALEAFSVSIPKEDVALEIGLLISASTAYVSKAERYGDLGNIQLAIKYAADAKDLAANEILDNDMSTAIEMILSQALILRYHQMKALSDLSEAIGCLQRARVTGSGHVLFLLILNNLGETLRLQFSRTRNVTCLIDAIDALEEVLVVASATDPARAMYHSNLSLILYDLFKLTQESDTLDRSIEMSDTAIRDTNPDDVQLPDRLSKNGSIYAARFDLTGNDTDMDKAISQTQAAINATPSDNPQCAQYYNNLGVYFMKRSLALVAKNDGYSVESRQDMEAAQKAYKYLLAMPIATPLSRALGDYSASSIAFNHNDLSDARAIVEETVKMLPKISPVTLDRSGQEHVLSDMSGFSSYATSIALQASYEASDALRLQEAARGVIAGLTISTRNDISDLKAQVPELASEYETCRNELSRTRPVSLLNSEGLSSTVPLSLGRYELNKRLEAVEDKIRREVPGFTNFQQPLTADAMKGLSGKGPIVSFNVSPIRSDAFIITTTNITTVSLPDLKDHDLTQNAKLFLEKPRITNTNLRKRWRNNQSLLKVLKWLWDVAVHPVLQALDIRQSAPGTKLPRIWWTASGLMALMPIHAAGDHSTNDAPNMLNFAIPSYTTTLKALAYARESEWKPLRRPTSEFAFVVSPKKAREDQHLTVEESARELDDTVRLHCKTKMIVGPSKSEALSVFETCNVVFLGCHGEPVSDSPCRSYLQLGSGPDSHLTIEEIQGSRHQRAQLAYLSACSTATVSAKDLVDEVVHIAGAFYLLGYRQVVGALWQARDIKARRVAKRFYEELMSVDGRDEDCVARAYYTSVMELRACDIRNPLLWATFVHFGA